MMLKSYWRKDGVSTIISEDNLVKQLSSRKNGIVSLSTHPCSDGETRIVQAMEQAEVFYCQDLVNELISIIKTRHGAPSADVLCKRLRKYPVIIIRFVDRIRGLSTTIETLATICTTLSGDHLLIVTGDELEHYVPELLQQMQAEEYVICR